MRIVDSEDSYSPLNPEAHHSFDLGIQTLGVVVEVQRVDVLVLLWRILGVGDRAVGASGEPFGMRGDPRVIGRCLECEVEGDLHSEIVHGLHERIEVGECSKIRMNGIVTAVDRADGPR